MSNVRWPDVLDHGAEVIAGYDTGVTLRQLFYRLVAEQWLPNVQPYYRRLERDDGGGTWQGPSRIARP